MINRRHIRIKVMQSFYAMLQSENQNFKTEENFLLTNISKVQDLYVLMLSLLVEIKNESFRVIEISKLKHLATPDELNPNEKFINNKVILNIENSTTYLAYIKDHNLKLWKENSEFVKIIWRAIIESDAYKSYMTTRSNNLKEDIAFIVNIYTNIIATNEKLYNFIEGANIGWIDDFPFVNTWILKSLRRLNSGSQIKIDALYKDEEDAEFALELFRKTALNHHKFVEDINKTTPNWDSDRIAELDMIFIKMALIEFIYFPTIPTKVTINEYLEIAKDYSTEKSSVFINGVLDKLLKEYQSENKIKKVSRGLL